MGRESSQLISWIGFSESGSRNCSRKRLALVGFEEELEVGVVGSVMKDWAFWRRLERVPVNIAAEALD